MVTYLCGGFMRYPTTTLATSVEREQNNEETMQISDTGNRTPSCRADCSKELMRGGNVSRYTISEQSHFHSPVLP